MAALTWDQVTAWRLKRSGLTRRAATSKLETTVQTMCGAHAQLMPSVPLALAARVSRLKQERVDAALERRSLVKTWAMRGTLHVFAADDVPLYCAAQRTRDQYNNPSFLKFWKLEVADLEAVQEAITTALDGRALTRDELADEILRITKRPQLEEGLRSGWGVLLKPAAFRGLLCFGVQSGRTPTFVRADQWIGSWKEFDTDDALREAFRRFLSTYAPASRAELARWWGVRPPEAGRVVKLMGDEVVEVEVGGTKRWALAADVRSLRATRRAEGVRLLPAFDQILVMSAPHAEAIVDDEFQERIFRPRIAVWSFPAVLIDGRVRAGWRLERKKDRAIIRVQPFSKLTRPARTALAKEVESLATLLSTETELEVTES